jgi:chorismate mutase
MKNTTVTVDATRLMKKAKKAVKAVKSFDKACKKFGIDPRDVVTVTIRSTPVASATHPTSQLVTNNPK